MLSFEAADGSTHNEDKKWTGLLDSEMLLRDAHCVAQNSFGSAGVRISVVGSVDRGDAAFGSTVLHSGPNPVFQPEPENAKTLSELKEAVHLKMKATSFSFNHAGIYWSEVCVSSPA